MTKNKNRDSDRGEAAVMLSVAGALGAGVPLAAGVILTSDNVAGAFTFIVALAVGLISIGTGVGKAYTKFKSSIEAAVERDKLLADLVDRISRIEERQMLILRHFDKEHNSDS
jgi:hypothetical protein